MDFAAVILFLTLSYMRPHEWIPLVGSLRLAAFSLVLGMLATLFRARQFELKDLAKTPHDTLVLLFFGWIIVSAPGSNIDTWKQTYAFLLYYLVTVQALSNVDRIERFIKWWAMMIIIVAGLAVMSEHGLDLMNSYEITHGVMKDRLVLNVSIFNNPNALGHSLVPVVGMLYFMCIWKRPIFSRIFFIPLLFLPLYALYLTLSKGAFLSMFATILMIFTFGRHKLTQITILALACTAGWGAMHLLPRMNELDKTSKDQAIQGRVAAFHFGYDILHTKLRGIGYSKFQTEFEKVNHYSKASHSSYVEVGTEFGRTGLILYLGILYCAMRTLVTCKTRSDDEERIRRILFCCMVAFIVSSWMVDFAFRAAFFMMIGATAAFHRHLHGLNDVEEVKPMRPTPEIQRAIPVAEPIREPVKILPRWEPLFGAPVVATATAGSFAMTQAAVAAEAPTTIAVSAVAEEPLVLGIRWNKVGIIDIMLIVAWHFAWLRVWNYVVHHV